jgi:hypothetical protein
LEKYCYGSEALNDPTKQDEPGCDHLVMALLKTGIAMPSVVTE